MQFSREGNHTIRCVITEAEIIELGYSIDEIISNGARTQEFMNRIFDMAEQEFDTKFDMGLKTVRADILPNHTLSLTFSEHPVTEGVVEHIKDLIHGLMGSAQQGKWDEIKSKVVGATGHKSLAEVQQSVAEKQAAQKENEAQSDAKSLPPMKIIALFAFEELDTLICYAKQVTIEELPHNELYRFDDAYFLMMDMTDCAELDVKRLSALTDEYSADVFVGSEKRAFIYEHGTSILTDHAIEQLRTI